MTQIICDICKTPMTEEEAGSEPVFKLGGIEVALTIQDSPEDVTDLCHRCTIKVVKEGVKQSVNPEEGCIR